MKRRTAAIFAALLVLPATTTSASAAVGISLSPDGVSWSSQLPAPLFSSSTTWVPGDRRVETFYVRNDSDEPTELLLDVQNTAVTDLYDTGDVTIEARSEGPWIEIVGTDKHRLISQSPADSREPRRVDVAVTFERASSNQSQVLQLALSFGLRLIDADVIERGENGDYTISDGSSTDPDGDGGDGSGDGDGTDLPVPGTSAVGSMADLPDTGSSMTLLMPVLGAVSLLGGILIAGRARTREDQTS